MKGNRNFRWGRSMGAFALGATAGTAAGLLLAPASGKAVRKRITSEFRSLGRLTNKQLRSTRKVLAKKALVLRDAAVGRLGEGREWLVEKMSLSNGRHHPLRRRLAVRHR